MILEHLLLRFELHFCQIFGKMGPNNFGGLHKKFGSIDISGI